MLTIAVIALKGGVGKTSVTLGLAGAAWARGLRTLVVDLDPQGNASTVLDPGAVTLTSSDVLADPRPDLLAAAIAPSGWGAPIDVLVADPLLERYNAPAGREATLALRVALGASDHDLVLVDSPPSLAGLTRNALAAAHAALVVTEPSLFALQGAQAALDAIEAVRRDNLRLQAAGIAVNRVRPAVTEHRFRLAELAAAYPGLLLEPFVPDRAAVQQAQGACVPVQAWRSDGASQVADAFDDLLDQVLAVPAHAGPFGRVPA